MKSMDNHVSELAKSMPQRMEVQSIQTSRNGVDVANLITQRRLLSATVSRYQFAPEVGGRTNAEQQKQEQRQSQQLITKWIEQLGQSWQLERFGHLGNERIEQQLESRFAELESEYRFVVQ